MKITIASKRSKELMTSGVIIVALMLVAVTLVYPALAVVTVPMVLATVGSLWYRWLALVTLLIPVAVGEVSYAILLDTVDGGIVQKILVIIAFLALAGRLGTRIPPVSVIALLVVLSSAGIIFLVVGDFDLMDPSRAVKATAGYLLAWLAFFVDWRTLQQSKVAILLAGFPVAVVLFGLFLDWTQVHPLFIQEYTGAYRLQAGMFAAYVASSGLFGVIGSVWLFRTHRVLALVLGTFALATIVASGTRTPLAATMIFLVWAVLTSSGLSIKARLIGLGGLMLTGLAAIPFLLPRFAGSSSAGSSGRDSAWRYLFSKVEESPIWGHGIGAHYGIAENATDPKIAQFFRAPHNTYLQWLLDFGVVGTALVIVSLVAVFLFVARASGEGRLVLGIGLIVAGYSLTDNVFAAMQPAILLPIVLAALVAGQFDWKWNDSLIGRRTTPVDENAQ